MRPQKKTSRTKIFRGHEFYKLAVAMDQQLIQVTVWLPPTEEELDFILKEYARFRKDELRSSLLVYHKEKIALYANRVA